MQEAKTQYYPPTTHFYLNQGSASVGSGESSEPSDLIECVAESGHLLRCATPAQTMPQSGLIAQQNPTNPFHYFINEQAKSLAALQELQNEVSALLEFREIVIETFPSLRSKLSVSPRASLSASPPPLHVHNMSTGSPRIKRTAGPIAPEWEPGVRVKRKILPHKEDGAESRMRGIKLTNGNKSHTDVSSTSVVQDSGFSTETTSSKEATSQEATAKELLMENELWNLLDTIQRKGVKLRDDVQTLQNTICNNTYDKPMDYETIGRADFRHLITAHTHDDVTNLRHERDLLLEKMADMESENLAGRVQVSRLRADLETLLIKKNDLEEQLQLAVMQKCELNSRIHNLHAQFVLQNERPGKCVKMDDEPLDDDVRDVGGDEPSPLNTFEKSPLNDSQLDRAIGSALDGVCAEQLDSQVVAAILSERDPLVLQRNLLVCVANNQHFKEKLDELADKDREECEILRLKLESKTIELEGTLARMRLMKSPATNARVDETHDARVNQTKCVTTPLRKLSNMTFTHVDDDKLRLRDYNVTPRRRASKIPTPGGSNSLGSNKHKSSCPSLTRPNSALSSSTNASFTSAGSKSNSTISLIPTPTYAKNNLTSKSFSHNQALSTRADALNVTPKVTKRTRNIASYSNAYLRDKRDGLSGTRVPRLSRDSVVVASDDALKKYGTQPNLHILNRPSIDTISVNPPDSFNDSLSAHGEHTKSLTLSIHFDSLSILNSDTSNLDRDSLER